MQQQVIEQMKTWVSDVIVKYNFCPFARKEVEANSIFYQISDTNDIGNAVVEMIDELGKLEQEPKIETTLLVFAKGFADFEDFLELVDLANAMLVAQGFEGKYQIANFHPNYVFADSDEQDPANYTNRAPYPSLHLIREASMELALQNHPDPESIPETNIKLAQRKGLHFWQELLSNCVHGTKSTNK